MGPTKHIANAFTKKSSRKQPHEATITHPPPRRSNRLARRQPSTAPDLEELLAIHPIPEVPRREGLRSGGPVKEQAVEQIVRVHKRKAQAAQHTRSVKNYEGNDASKITSNTILIIESTASKTKKKQARSTSSARNLPLLTNQAMSGIFV